MINEYLDKCSAGGGHGHVGLEEGRTGQGRLGVGYVQNPESLKY